MLAYFKPMFHFYTPWKRQKTRGFLTFLVGIEIEHWLELGYEDRLLKPWTVAWKHLDSGFPTVGIRIRIRIG